MLCCVLFSVLCIAVCCVLYRSVPSREFFQKANDEQVRNDFHFSNLKYIKIDLNIGYSFVYNIYEIS